MKLLIVEDDDSARQLYKRSVDSLKDFKITLEFAESYEKALEKFQELDPDCVFIDIRLSSGDVTNTKGNDLFKFISKYKSSKIIRIITGHSGDIEPGLEELANNSLFKIHVRTDLPFVDIITETYNLFNSPIYTLINNDDEVSSEIRSIYYSQIDSLISNSDIQKGVEKSRLLRYVAANLYERFSVNETSLDEVYDWEMFFSPPILDFVYTGDVIKKNDSEDFFIVLTPSCDLTPRNNGSTNVNECLLAKLNLVDLRDCVNKETKGFSGKGEEIIRNKKQSFHFIPEIKGKGPFNIDFKIIKHVSKTAIDSDYTRIATISPAFMKENIKQVFDVLLETGTT